VKIPVQEKIAELEWRIARLESNPCRCRVVTSETVSNVDFTSNPHWKALWKEFDALMKSMFKRKA